MTTIQLRRGTATEWISADSVLGAGEPGVETDSGKFKIGDGTTSWTSLAYATDNSRLPGSVGLKGSRRLFDMRSATVLASPPTVGPYSAGYQLNGDVAAATGGGYGIATAQVLKASYTAPYADTRFRIRGGHYVALNNNDGIDCGAVQSVIPGPAYGPAAKLMIAYMDWHALSGNPLLIRTRDTTTTQKLTVWLSANGGPFQPNLALNSPQSLTSPGDSLYHLLPISAVSPGTKYTVMLQYTSGTFGGVVADVRDVVTYPSLSANRTLLIVGDSYCDIDVATSGYTSLAAGYACQLAWALGMDPYISAYGGTGFSATAGGSTAYNYQQRLPLEVVGVAPADVAAIWVQPSINDGLYNFAGTTQLNSDIRSCFEQLQAAFPSIPMFTGAPMRPYRGQSSANANDVTVGAQIKTIADELGVLTIPDLTNSSSGLGLLTGSGYLGHLVGDGSSDFYSWSDTVHYQPAFGRAAADTIATQIAATVGLTLA